jgi:phosphohistidine phosphatase
MRVYLVRHGKALTKEVDPEQKLSEEGRVVIERVGRVLHRCGVEVQTLLHSKKARARETAEIIASCLDSSLLPLETPGLAPLDDVHEMVVRIQGSQGGLMIVGHLPYLAKLTSAVLGVPQTIPVVEFKPGGVACLGGSADGHWAIAWMLASELTKGLP